jgi:RNA polymerase sigma factor (sigma-70 family)
MPPFDEIYEEHVWRVYGFIAYRVRSREDAEDLTSQTFERALRAWHRYDARLAPPGPWLITIARNLVIDHFRGTPAGGSRRRCTRCPTPRCRSLPSPTTTSGSHPSSRPRCRA